MVGFKSKEIPIVDFTGGLNGRERHSGNYQCNVEKLHSGILPCADFDKISGSFILDSISSNCAFSTACLG